MSKRFLSRALGTLVLAAPLLLAIGGCASREAAPPAPQQASGLVAGAFVEQWSTTLPLQRQSVSEFYAVNDRLFAHSRRNMVYSLSAGGTMQFIRAVAEPGEKLGRGVQLEGNYVFPLTNQLEIISPRGDLVRSLTLTRPIRSPLASEGEQVYLGLDAQRGGHLARISPLKEYAWVDWEVLTGAIVSRPVVQDSVVYAATDDGRVFAVLPSSTPRAAWTFRGGYFQADRSVAAPLVADEYGVYVAGRDSKLYALDRGNGRIRWQYFAQAALVDAPYAAPDRIYQPVPDTGVVAIGKTAGEFYRKALWTVPNATKVLYADTDIVYAFTESGTVVALKHATGEKLYETKRGGFMDAALLQPEGSDEPLIVGVTAKGEMVAYRPSNRPMAGPLASR